MHTVHKREGRSLYQLAAYTFAAAPPHAVLAMGQPFGAAAHVRRFFGGDIGPLSGWGVGVGRCSG